MKAVFHPEHGDESSASIHINYLGGGQVKEKSSLFRHSCPKRDLFQCQPCDLFDVLCSTLNIFYCLFHSILHPVYPRIKNLGLPAALQE